MVADVVVVVRAVLAIIVVIDAKPLLVVDIAISCGLCSFLAIV